MPRLTKSLPKYRKHRASGQAIVTIATRDFYLGPYDTKASKLEYDRIIAEWLAGGRQPLVVEGEADGLTVVELMARHLQFARGHYRKDGRPTSEADEVRLSLRPVCKLMGGTSHPSLARRHSKPSGKRWSTRDCLAG